MVTPLTAQIGRADKVATTRTGKNTAAIATESKPVGDFKGAVRVLQCQPVSALSKIQARFVLA